MVRVCLLLLVFCCSNFAFAGQRTITVIAGEWPNFTNTDGTGTYWEIMKVIYEDQYQLELKTTAWSRAYNMMNANKADAIVGLYAKEQGALIFPKQHIDREYAIYALYDKDKHNIQSANDLSKLTIAGRSNYGFEHFIPKDIHYYGLDSIYDTNKLVINERVDALLVSAYNLKRADPTNSLVRTKVIPAQKLYVGFKNNKFGQELAKIFDDKMKTLISQRKLEALFPSPEEFRHANLESNQENSKDK